MIFGPLPGAPVPALVVTARTSGAGRAPSVGAVALAAAMPWSGVFRMAVMSLRGVATPEGRTEAAAPLPGRATGFERFTPRAAGLAPRAAAFGRFTGFWRFAGRPAGVARFTSGFARFTGRAAGFGRFTGRAAGFLRFAAGFARFARRAAGLEGVGVGFGRVVDRDAARAARAGDAFLARLVATRFSPRDPWTDTERPFRAFAVRPTSSPPVPFAIASGRLPGCFVKPRSPLTTTGFWVERKNRVQSFSASVAPKLPAR
jgi:hypothetical protein